MVIRLGDSIKPGNSLFQKLLPAASTVKNGVRALRRSRPPLRVAFRRLDHLDRLDIPVYYCSTCGLGTRKTHPGGWIFRHESYGKGLTAAQSRASAIMEFVERYSCQSFFDNKRNFFAGDSKAAGSVRSELISLALEEKFRQDRMILETIWRMPLWARASSLTSKKDAFIPLWLQAPTTSGFSAGNSREEAILQGICEVIERHRIVAVIGVRAAVPAIDIRSIDHGRIRAFIAKFRRAGIRLFIRDFSGDWRIPTMGVLSYDPKLPKGRRIFCAAGTSMSRDVALIRALTEIAQHRCQVQHRKTYIRTFMFPHYETLKAAACLTRAATSVDFHDIPTFSHENLRVEIERAVRILADRGLEVLVIDTTDPVVGIPSVIVSIPGIAVPKYYKPFHLIRTYYGRKGRRSRYAALVEHFLKHYPEELLKNTSVKGRGN